MPFEKKEEHPSYGLLSISRQGSNKNRSLFGSSIKHQRTVCLRIKRAAKERNLNRHWYFARETLIEIEMSPVQFSEAITSFNYGDGVPVTIDFVKGEGKIESCPEDSIRDLFVDEFEKDIDEISERLDDLMKIVTKMKSETGGLKAKEKKDLCEKIEMLNQNLKSNLPFVLKQFNEQMEKSVGEAKGEIDSFITNLTLKLGSETLKEKIAGGLLT